MTFEQNMAQPTDDVAREARMEEMAEWAHWTGAMVEAKAFNHGRLDPNGDRSISEHDATQISQSPAGVYVEHPLPFRSGSTYRELVNVSNDENGTVKVDSDSLKGSYRSPANIRNDNIGHGKKISPRVI